VALLALLMSQAPRAAADHQPPLTERNFMEAAPQGFGDRHNSWAWAMQWWNGHLYVGTNRAYNCVTAWELAHLVASVFAYPPEDPDLACTPDPADLPIQAEIWRWTPGNQSWARVYQAPADIPNPDRPGKFVPRDNGYRTMTVHKEPDGTEALYVGAINTKAMWNGDVPPPRILRSTDGVTFTPIPQTPGTFMGDLTKGSFRGLTSFNGQLYVLNGSVQGTGVILASADPKAGDNAWRQVSPDGLQFFDMEVFNGQLYAGGVSPAGGYAVFKTRAQGDPPYDFITVVPEGGYLTPDPSVAVVSMEVFNDRLFVGTDDPGEIVRVNADDTWDLIAGTPRMVPDTNTTIYPLTGVAEGFGNEFVDHIWRMQAHDGQLYFGAYDSSILHKESVIDDVRVAEVIGQQMGFDLVRTADGWYTTPITTNGFDNRLSFGVRNFASTPFGLFLGTANGHDGLQIFRGLAGQGGPQLPAPARLEVEAANADPRPVLSWEPVPTARQYRVFRAPLKQVEVSVLQVRDDIPIPDALKKTVHFPGDMEDIGVTRDTVFVVPPPTSDAGLFFYTVVAEDGPLRSAFSNRVHAPAFNPPMTFARVLVEVSRLNRRGRFTSAAAAAGAALTIQRASGLATAGDPEAVDLLQSLRTRVLQGAVVYDPDAVDLEIQLSKLIRRLKLAKNGLITQTALF
jgi:hypothetical protein